MLKKTVCIDIGTHSIKAYSIGSDRHIEKLLTRSWELIEGDITEDRITLDFSSFYSDLCAMNISQDTHHIIAIATEGVRRNPLVQEVCAGFLQLRGIEFRLLSQAEEGRLIKSAFKSTHKLDDVAIVDAGGGSMQIILPNEERPILVPFGISDLNLKYHLNSEEPEHRDIDGAIGFLEQAFPASIGRLAYTGGERTYLEAMHVPLENGWVKSADFAALVDRMQRHPMSELRQMSPFDEKWMNGAIASNSIVTALNKASSSDRFFASDISISQAIILEIDQELGMAFDCLDSLENSSPVATQL